MLLRLEPFVEPRLSGHFGGASLLKRVLAIPKIKIRETKTFRQSIVIKSKRNHKSKSSEAGSAVAAAASKRNAETGLKLAKRPLALAAAREATAIRARKKEEASLIQKARARRVFIKRLFATVPLRKTSSAVLILLFIAVIASIKIILALTTSAKSYRIEVKTSVKRKIYRRKRYIDSQHYR
ncbi:hypothetical protein MBM_06689 [Drepanopeziza brunnea f. sp. 'multigermtubi' MB_m1]|uniref:Uncharacterized protein n=1 Tax=Marssonina brunnea f. sp. multigermtubi (strain MB_m1) TaxID=1072389 RepID=K1X449_MARBU|nr:uncharacterized protein MBM_06689 [Drepanopeziza brunnea f. sp. 'multigermtubi' MB_m1]EKD15473.1 hypothetical protein MBM_06689 [Drepanopeziza brunnea f. sp. 'multigermtubi' MB_m1]